MFLRKIPKSVFSFNERRVQLFSSSNSQFHFKFDVFQSTDSSKRFYFPSNSSIFSVENLLKNGDASMKTVDFSYSDSSPIDKSSNFLDVILKRNLKLSVNSNPFAYKLDAFQDLGYFTNSNYDQVYKQKEIPFPQVSVFSALFQAYGTRFAKENQNESINAQQLQENLIKVLKNFPELNQIKIKEIEANLEQCVKELNYETKKLEKLEEQLSSEAKKTLKFWLTLTTIQFVVLFYICYYVYGWDFTEPIGYLISLGIETAAMAYFLKGRGELGQNALFASKLNQLKPAVLAKNSTNPNVVKDLLKEKVTIHKRGLLYGKI